MKCKYEIARERMASHEFKAVVKRFKLKRWIEMQDFKTDDYVVHLCKYEAVKQAMQQAGIPCSMSNQNGYAYRLSVL